MATTDRITEAETQAKGIKWESYYTEPYPGKDETEVLTWIDNCARCGGTGYIRAYAHVDAGICYDCVAKGMRPKLLVKTTVGAERAKAKKAAQRQAGAARKAIREQARKDQEEAEARDSRIGRYPAMHLLTREGVESLDLTEWERDTLTDLRHKDREYGLSEKQVEFAARLIDAALVKTMAAPLAEAIKAQKEAAKTPAPEGRLVVTGTVVKVKDVESHHGYTTSWTRRLCIETEEGWTLFANASSELEDAGYDAEEAEVEAGAREHIRRVEEEDVWTTHHYLVGRKVQMKITVTPSDRDASQGFGKRPHGAKLV